MKTRKMTPFSSSILWAPIRWHISFLHFKKFKIQFHGVSPLHYLLICKIDVNMPKTTLSSLLTEIPFFYIKFANFWNIKCFAPKLMPIRPWSHVLQEKISFLDYRKSIYRKFTQLFSIRPKFTSLEQSYFERSQVVAVISLYCLHFSTSKNKDLKRISKSATSVRTEIYLDNKVSFSVNN